MNNTADAAFLKALTTEGLERFDITHDAVVEMYESQNYGEIDRLMLLALGTHGRGWVRSLLMSVKPIKDSVNTEVYDRLVNFLKKGNEERYREQKEQEKEVADLKQENERLRGWMEMLERAPGEAHETIRERALSSHYLQPIVGGWKNRVEELESRLRELEGMEVELRTDYDALFEHICKSEKHTALGLVDYEPREKPLRDVVRVRRWEAWDIVVGVRGMQYGGVASYDRKKGGTEREKFVEDCKRMNLAFVLVEPEG